MSQFGAVDATSSVQKDLTRCGIDFAKTPIDDDSHRSIRSDEMSTKWMSLLQLVCLVISIVFVSVGSKAMASTDEESSNSLLVGGHVEERVLSSCYVDPAFRSGGVYFTYVGSNGYGNVFYYKANYKHGYISKEKVLITTFDAYGNIAQQMTVDRNKPASVLLTSPTQYSTMNYIEYRRAEATQAMKVQYDNEVAGRMLMQCVQQ